MNRCRIAVASIAATLCATGLPAPTAAEPADDWGPAAPCPRSTRPRPTVAPTSRPTDAASTSHRPARARTAATTSGSPTAEEGTDLGRRR